MSVDVLPASLETARLRLRAPRPADADAIFAGYAQDAEITRYLMWTPHRSVAETRAFVADCIAAWQVGPRRPYVLTTHDDDTAIGMLDAIPRATRLTIGYVLARPAWGRGLMVEAVDAVTTAALAHPDCFRVEAFCDVDNLGSARLLEKAGFVREGRMERYNVHPNVSTEPRACFLYARWR